MAYVLKYRTPDGKLHHHGLCKTKLEASRELARLKVKYPDWRWSSVEVVEKSRVTKQPTVWSGGAKLVAVVLSLLIAFMLFSQFVIPALLSGTVPGIISRLQGLGYTVVAQGGSINVRFLDETGTAYGIRNINNKPYVTNKPYTFDVAENQVPDASPFRRFGHNSDIGAGWETLYHLNQLYIYLPAAQKLKVISSSANDTPGNTGARTLFMRGLDTNYDIISETITLNGNVAYVETNETYLRLFTAYVVTAGAAEGNVGVITIDDNAEVVTIDEIPVGEGQIHSAVWTVPAGHTAYITQIFFSEATNKGIEFALWMRRDGVWRMMRSWVELQEVSSLYFDFPLRITERIDIELRAMGVAVAANATGGFEGWYERN